MDGVDARFLGDAQDFRDRQIGFDRSETGTDLIGLVGLEAVQRQPVLLGEDGDRPEAQLVGSAEDANGNFGSVWRLADE